MGIHLKAIAVALYAGIAVSVFAGGASAQEPFPIVRADNDAYLVGETAIVTVTDLPGCAGQDVELGLVQSPGDLPAGTPAPVGDSTPLVTVAADGSASVAIPVSVELLPAPTDPVVRGACVPRGGLVRGEPMVIPVMLVDLQANQKKYYSDEIAVVTLTGLLSCAGQQVELGLAQTKLFEDDPDPIGDATPLVTVDSNGSAVARIQLTPYLIPFHTAPIVSGSCVPGGIASGRPRAMTVRSAPSPPGTGSGLARDGGSVASRNIVVAGLATVAVSVLLAAAARRRDRR